MPPSPQPPPPPAPADGLRAVLVALRRDAGVRVARARGETAPFPLHLTFTLEDAPPAAAAYDVPCPVATIRVTVPATGLPSVAAVEGGLPRAAREAVASALNAVLSAAPTPAAALAALPTAAANSVMPAIIPHAEPYECANAEGRTVRRFALPSDESATIVVDTSLPPPPPTRPVERDANIELRWLTRRFGGALTLEGGNNDDDSVFFTITFTPADPAWPRAAGPVTLRGSLDRATYPQAGSFALAPAAVASAQGAALAAALANAVSAATDDPRAVRNVLKYIDSNSAEVWAAAAAAAAPKRAAADAAPSGPRFALRLAGLALDGLDALTPVTLAIATTCGKCGGGVDVTLDASAAASGWPSAAAACSRCATLTTLAASPAVAHAHSNTLATIVAVGDPPPHPTDVLPSTLSAQCGGCGTLFALRGATPGAWLGRACAGCGARARARFEGVVFEGAAETQQAAGGRAAVPAASRAPATTPDSRARPTPGPLPDGGACRHYRRSRRHFRFPCCGRVYACDLCHEEGEAHDLKLATRHVCGACGVEQPIKPDCASCGLNLTGKGHSGPGTRHWEGGAGCRDKSRMDPRDAAKWRGSKAKTASRKASRVGAEGKARREGG